MNPERLYTQKLKEAVHEKIRENWDKEKQVTFAETYEGLHSISNKDGFYNEIKDEIDEALTLKFGLEIASRKSVSKDSIRRFLDMTYDKTFSDKNKDAFSVYSGYKDFKDFCLQNKEEKVSHAQTLIRKPYLIVSVFSLLALISLYWSYAGQTDEAKFSFVIENGREIYLEDVVELDYDLKDLDYNRALFDINGQIEIIQKREGRLKFKVRSPGRKFIRLLVDGKAIMTKPLFVKTRDWWASVNLNRPINDYPYIQDGIMRLPQELASPGSPETYGNFQFFKDFNLNTDALVFETRVKNSQEMGGFWAYDVSLNLFGEDGNQLLFNLLAPDAIIYANLKVADTHFETPEERALLSKMGVDLSYWRNVKVILKNQNVQILIDEELIFESPYVGQIGSLCGVQYFIKGRGAVDNIKISNLDGKVVFEDDFIR